MRQDQIVMLNGKAAIIAQLESALLADERNGLDSICYEYNLETGDEIITAMFEGGGIKKILATAAKEIINAIY